MERGLQNCQLSSKMAFEEVGHLFKMQLQRTWRLIGIGVLLLFLLVMGRGSLNFLLPAEMATTTESMRGTHGSATKMSAVILPYGAFTE